MKEQRITIRIDPQGRITAEAVGFTGDACMEDLERLLEGLAPGKATVDRKPDAGTARVTTTRTQGVGKKP
ncbi:MAG: DUF2997 domain-containing protein [Candidatus Sericytochromatia bacterium]|nr:DUF2997 domain-containing protein [Candidatus Sericytochromatia bacterium]